MTRFIALLSLSAVALIACGNAEPEAPDTDAAPAEETATDNTAADTAADDNTPPSYPAPEGSQAGGAMILGDENAPVTIVEYASTVCPACAAFHIQLFPKIKEKYIDTGMIRFEYREFPTNPQNLAYAGAYLARCSATDKGAPAYFAMLKTLYEHQREWAYGQTPGDELEKLAAQVGIDRDGLEQCFYREDVVEAVKANIRTGIEEDDVRSTPTLMVDGEPLDWGRSEEGLMAAIDAEIAKHQQ